MTRRPLVEAELLHRDRTLTCTCVAFAIFLCMYVFQLLTEVDFYSHYLVNATVTLLSV